MRRRSILLLVLLAGALALAAGAAASNGGISPVAPVSPNAHRITDAYWLIVGITGAIFLLVETTLVVFLVKFRRRGRSRTADAPQIESNTRLEIAWTVVPVLLLAVIVSFVFYKLPGIKNAPAAGNRLEVRVEAHQFYWLFKYPDGSESVNTLTVPVNEVVTLDIVSPDVIHSWWVPALGGKIDAIPGTVNHTWFKAEKTGRYVIRCAEFCGIQHAVMHGFVDVVDTARAPVTAAQLGKQAFEGVCASCHGFQGEGLIGPAIAGSSVLADAKATRDLIRNGKGLMPAVGKTWDEQLMKATLAYLRTKVAGGGANG